MQADHKWMASHPKELYKFAGKWVAVLDGKIVFSGNTYEGVWSKVKTTHPGKVPLITYVLKPGEEQLIA